jgi:succinate dehydrogenase / fumarate reductase cytochrome b subunit
MLLTPWLLWFALGLVGADVVAVRSAIAMPLNAVLLIAFFATVFWHAQLGLQVVIEDYVHGWLELALQVAVKFACALAALAAGPERWDAFAACAGSPFGKLVLFGFSWSLAFHLINGIRHLVQDAGHGYAIPEFVRSSWLSVIGSFVLVALAWGVVLAHWGHA